MMMRERLPMAPLLRFMNRVRHVPGEQLREGYTGFERDNRRGGVAPIFSGSLSDTFRQGCSSTIHSWPLGPPWADCPDQGALVSGISLGVAELSCGQARGCARTDRSGARHDGAGPRIAAAQERGADALDREHDRK